MINKFILFVVAAFLLLNIPIAQAQSAKVIVQNSGTNVKPAIKVKWYSQELLYEEGVHVYRKATDDASWTRLTMQSLKRKADIDQTIYAQDPEMRFFVQVVKEAKKTDFQGFLLLNIMVKSFQSSTYADFLGVQYEDASVVAGKTYEYRINRIKGSTELTLGTSAPITVGPYQPNNSPENFEVKVEGRKAMLNWKPEEERFYGVNIYRSSADAPAVVRINQNPVMLSITTNKEGVEDYPEIKFVDDTLQENNRYRYYITGLDFFGNETRPSPVAEVYIRDNTPPANPINLRQKVKDQQVILNWQNQSSEDQAGLHVYRSTHSEGPFEKVNTSVLKVTDTTFTDKPAQPAGYYYYVVAVDTAGNEATSEKVFAEIQDITPPAQPTGLVLQSDTGKVQLHWEKNLESDLMGYLIYRTVNTNDKENFVLINAEPITENSFVDKLPRNASNKFLYKVIAMDTAYNKSKPSEVAVIKLPDVTPPEKPFIKNVFIEGSHPVVEWLPNREEDLKGYRIYRTEAANQQDAEIVNSNLIKPIVYRFTDVTAQPEKHYYYSLTAVDSSENESVRSKVLMVQVPPTKNNLVPRNFKVAFNKRQHQVNLSWEVAEAALGYVIYRKTAAQESFIPLTGMLKEGGYQDKAVDKGITYMYELRVYYDTGLNARSEVVNLRIND